MVHEKVRVINDQRVYKRHKDWSWDEKDFNENKVIKPTIPLHLIAVQISTSEFQCEEGIPDSMPYFSVLFVY